MKDLPLTPGSSSIRTDLPSTETKSEPEHRFKEKAVGKVKPDDQRSLSRFTRARATESLSADLREREAEYSSETGSYYSQRADSAKTDSSILTDHEAQYFEFAEDDEATSYSSDICRPSTDFPVSVPSVTERASTHSGGSRESARTQNASITIEGGGQVHGNGPESTPADDAAMTVDGVGRVPQNAFKSMVKRLWNWAVDFASNHKITIALALSILFVFIMVSPAGPGIVGGVLGAALLGSLGMSISCALAGAIIVDLIGKTGPFAQQVPPPMNRPDQSSQNSDAGQKPQAENQSEQIPQPEPSRSLSRQDSAVPSSTSDKVKPEHALKRQKTGSVARSEGQFFLTPLEEMSRATGISASESAENMADVANGVGPGKPFSMAVFNQWLSENFSRWASREQYAEFSRQLRKSDNFQALVTDGVLDRYLEELNQKSLDLSMLASSPLRQPASSAAVQERKLYQFANVFESAMKMLDPSPEHCRTMSTQLLRLLPKEEFPWVSSDLWAPLLSTGDRRKSLEGFSRGELAQVEASDFLRLSLQGLERFANQKQPELDSLDGDRANSPAGNLVASDTESSLGDERSRDDASVITEVTSIESDDELLSLDDELLPLDDEELTWDGLQQPILSRLRQLPGLKGFNRQLPEVARNKVNFEAFFTNIVSAVVQWNENPRSQSTAGRTARTNDYYQNLVVNSLARGIFEAGFRMMQETPESIKIDTASGRKSFLDNIYTSPEVDKIFAEIDAQKHEQVIARNYLRSFIK